jgi:hypothetical protein
MQYIERNDGSILYHKKPETRKERDRKMQQFKNDYVFDIGGTFDKYKNSLEALITGKSKEAEIAENLYLEQETLEYIFQ